jgi:hypothetical protein
LPPSVHAICDDGSGGVVKAVRRCRLGHSEVAHAGLDHGDAGQRVEAQDLVEAGERQNDALGVRHRAARQAGPRAARNDRYT